MRKTELLAPAKDKRTAIAAINCGADAVYIGAANFGARKNAPNSLENIKEIVDYAHKFYVKVHVTVNTILTDEELEQAKELIKKLYDIGVDAIIVQDTGILELAVRGEIPPIVLHASTQCNNRTLEKAEFFDKTGLSRVILARELSIEQIKEICSNIKAEVETFVHGALCVSYSGQCYLSQYIGGRSANRGECAQPCRKKYTLVDEKGNIIAENKHLLSLRDFNASKHLKNLTEVGVKSFKIEGRLKDENYVKNVVAYYRNELDKISAKTSSGKCFLDFEPDVNKSFNRGFTDYFLEGRKKCFNFDSPKSTGEKLGRVIKVYKDCFEIKFEGDKKIINPQDGLCFFNGDELSGCLVNKVLSGKIYPNKMNGITSGMIVYRNYDVEFEKKLTNTRTKRRIKVDFSYENGILTALDEDSNRVQISVVSAEKANNPEKMLENFKNQLQKTGDSDFYTGDIEINEEVPFLPVSEINSLRRDILKNLMNERLKNYPREIQQPLHYTKFPYEEYDYHANVHNKAARKFYEKCGCKILEKSFESSLPRGSTVELMRCKHCLKFAFDLCKSPVKLFLIDEKGEKYPLKFDCKNCEMAVLKP